MEFSHQQCIKYTYAFVTGKCTKNRAYNPKLFDILRGAKLRYIVFCLLSVQTHSQYQRCLSRSCSHITSLSHMSCMSDRFFYFTRTGAHHINTYVEVLLLGCLPFVPAVCIVCFCVVVVLYTQYNYTNRNLITDRHIYYLTIPDLDDCHKV